ncbi:AAA ATPase [Rhizina undulata]
MAGTTCVLGKRTRSTTANASSSSPQGTPARRVKFTAREINDEDSDDENDGPAVADSGMFFDGGLVAIREEEEEEEEETPRRSRSRQGRKILVAVEVKVNRVFKASKKSPNSADAPKTISNPPATPRHARTLKKPTTPRHRVSLVGKPTTPRGKLFTTPTSCATPSTTTVLSGAKSLFSRSAAPGKLIGRETEKAQLAEFLEKRISSRSGGCLYVSGPPGCGKSALLTEVMGEVGVSERGVRTAFVNCMAVTEPRGIYAKLLGELQDADAEEGWSGLGNEELEALVLPKKSNKNDDLFVVVLDEIDHLLSKDGDHMYTIFEWSLRKSSRLILIGIANALDLTERFLPKFKARNLTPEHLPFLPYSADQIASVITSKLRSLLPRDVDAPPDFIPYVHPAAIQLLSRKVASATGDLRKAFDLCRKAIEVVESEIRSKDAKERLAAMDRITEKEREHEKENSGVVVVPGDGKRGIMSPLRMPLVENMNLASPALVPRRAPQTALTAPRVTIAHIARVSSAAFGGSSINRVKLLNLQQKAVLCALVTSEAKGVKGAVAIRELFATYTQLCKRERMLAPLSSTEFQDVVASLEAAGVVGLSSGGLGTPSRRGRGAVVGGGDERRIAPLVGREELVGAVGEVGPILLGLFREKV